MFLSRWMPKVGNEIGTIKHRCSSRQRLTVTLAALFVAATSIAWWLGMKSQSPDQAAARAAEPVASWITAPVERRELAATVTLRGDVRAATSIAIGVPTSVTGDPVVTHIGATTGDDVSEGTNLVEISGRPVFLFQGEVPSYRTLRPGMSGADVLQIQKALSRLGFAPDTDGVFGERTKKAILKFYQAGGYEPIPATTTGSDDIATAELTLAQANGAVSEAQATLEIARQGQPASVVAQAEANLNTAERSLDNARKQQRIDVDAANANIDSATVERDRLAADPGTPPADLAAANSTLREATTRAKTVQITSDAAIADASDAVTIAQLRLDEANAPGNTGPATVALDNAVVVRDAAAKSLANVLALNGPIVPLGEIVFVQETPAYVQSSISSLGVVGGDLSGTDSSMTSSDSGGSSSVTSISPQGLMRLSGETLVTTALVTTDKVGFVKAGTSVELLDEDSNKTYPGVVSSISDKLIDRDGLKGFEVAISATKSLPRMLIGKNIRVTITAAVSKTKTLVVPVAAISADASGKTRVSVLAAPGKDPVEVAVIPGLSADGYVSVAPVRARTPGLLTY